MTNARLVPKSKLPAVIAQSAKQYHGQQQAARATAVKAESKALASIFTENPTLTQGQTNTLASESQE